MKALLIVDVQNDFVPGGALAVSHGDQVVPIINHLQQHFEMVVATQDWHPADHGSFAANHPGRRVGEFIELNGLRQILWPIHCVQFTPGAGFHPDLIKDRWQQIFQKGSNPDVDSYSGFYDNDRQGDTGLCAFLRAQGARELYVCGLATDYCVKYTVLDALSEGFDTHLIQDACRGVELNPGDSNRAINEMKLAGAKVVSSEDIIDHW